MPNIYLVRPEHIPTKAAFPVVDAHNHLWGKWDLPAILSVLDEVGVVCFADLTANARIAFADGGYRLEEGDFDAFRAEVIAKYPGRFYGFTMATFCRPTNKPLFTDDRAFVAETLEMLRHHVSAGARGLKVTKELGLLYRDSAGQIVFADDPRLFDIWEEPGRLGVPVLIHQSDPWGFHEPVTPDNEHYDTMLKYPSWSFADERFPRKLEILRHRDNLLAQHPGTTFILPHVANWPENLEYVSQLLEKHPNAYIDFSARMDELGRQPYAARRFMIRWQDRIIFGSDMPPSADMYRCYWRFLETFDEYFFPPDYDGTFLRGRWGIYGLGLPKEVLAKIYYKNALKLIPGLRADYRRQTKP